MRDRSRRILGFLLALVFVAALFVLVLGVGFALNPPDLIGLRHAIAPVAVLFLASGAGLVQVIRSLKGSPPPPLGGFRLRPRRIAPTPAQLDYDRNPACLATCSHLQPIERDMRGTSIKVRLRYGNVVTADCCVDEPLLYQHYNIAAPVYFMPDMPGDRPGSPPSALFSCREHSSVIEIVHTAEARPGLPVFPLS